MVPVDSSGLLKPPLASLCTLEPRRSKLTETISCVTVSCDGKWVYTSVQPGVFSLRVGERLYALHRDRGGEWFFGVFPGQDDPLEWFPTKAVSPPAFLAVQED